MDHSREEIEYYRVEEWCRDRINDGSDFLFDPVLFQAALKEKSEGFDFPLESLQSLFRNMYVKHIKSTSHQIQSILHSKFIKEYLSGRSIKDLAKESNFSAALLARRLVEEMTVLGKKKLSTALKNPLEELGSIDVIKPKYQGFENQSQDSQYVFNLFRRSVSTFPGTDPHEVLSPTRVFFPFAFAFAFALNVNRQSHPSSTTKKPTRLALEVKGAIASDSLCGPASDRARHFIGIEYEIVLERELKNLGSSPAVNRSFVTI
jgi:hypothetical protein